MVASDVPSTFSSPLASALAAHTSDFVGVIDEHGVAIFMNRSVRGADNSDVEGKTLEEFLSPERAKRIRAMVEQARQTDQAVIVEDVRIDALDGGQRWFVEKCVPVREASNSLRFLLVRTETTHLRRAVELLRASEERYRTLFDSNPDPVVVADVTTLAIVAVNPAAARFYGVTADELAGASWLELFHADEREVVRAAYASNPARERWSTARQLRRDGTVVVTEIIDNPIAFAGVALRMAVVRDLTERQRLEVQLRHAEKMEAMGVFAGGIAHDFNNLLAVITACAGGLREADALDGEQREELEDLLAAVTRATNLTKKLLLFCRRLVLDTAPVELVQLVDELGAMLTRLVGSNVELSIVHETPTALVLGDRVELEQLVTNLVVNAGHAIVERGRVYVRTRVVDIDAAQAAGTPRARAGRYVELSVKDDGHGMDEATLARIFEPFYTTKTEGTGLGLAIVHGVVVRHSGFLRAESTAGAGTSIAVYLPLSESRPDVAKTSPLRAGTVRVLVADDEPMVRRVTERMLRHLGYEVVGAGDGEEALHTFEKDPDAFCAVVLDVMMPKLKGPEALARMRAIRPAMKSLLVSGYAGAPSELTALAGAHVPRVLQKPFTIAQLAEELRRIDVTAGDGALPVVQVVAPPDPASRT